MSSETWSGKVRAGGEERGEGSCVGGVSPDETRARGGRRYGLAVLFALNTFLVVALLLFVVTAVAWVSVTSGVVRAETWTNPLVLTIIALVVCMLLSSAILVMANGVVLMPVRRMVEAMKQLAQGHFDVRMETGTKAAVREVEDFVREFNIAAEKLGEVEILREGFIDDFSHEFKTPIASIKGFAELLESDDITDEERREYAGIIAVESRRLAALSDSLLALRRVESQTSLLAARPVRVSEQIRRMVPVMERAWAEKGVSFDLGLVDAVCQGDEALLDRAWANLLDNAAKFSETGGVVRVYCRETPDGWLLVRVCNGGTGIPKRALERVFDRFYQTDASHATKGNGLGLPLVKRVVELHGGTISVSSDSVETCFEVRLPQ